MQIFQAIFFLMILIYVHGSFSHKPATCLDHVKKIWPKDGVLRVEIVKNSSVPFEERFFFIIGGPVQPNTGTEPPPVTSSTESSFGVPEEELGYTVDDQTGPMSTEGSEEFIGADETSRLHFFVNIVLNLPNVSKTYILCLNYCIFTHLLHTLGLSLALEKSNF